MKLWGELLHNWTREAFDATPPEETIPLREVVKHPKGVGVADVTLRDGEQMPGISFTVEEKLKLIEMLSDAGFLALEIAYPAVSPEEVEVCKRAVAMKPKARLAVMTRMRKSDIDTVLQTGVKSVDIFTSASDLKMIYHLKLGKTPEEAREANLRMIEENVQYARDHGLMCAFGIEDCSRADMDYLAAMIAKFKEVAKTAGASTGPADTTGFMTPMANWWWARSLARKIKSTGLPFIMHCHNDYGMGTANSLAGWMGGAFGISGTINGIGERCGNTPIEEAVAALEFIYGVKTFVKTDRLPAISRYVEECTGIPVHPTKPIVGDNAFKHESGIHAGGAVLKPDADPQCYQGIIYESVPKHLLGIEASKYVFGKHSGGNILREVVFKPLGLPEPPPERMERFMSRIKHDYMKTTPRDKLHGFVEEFHRYIGSLGLSVEDVRRILDEEDGKPP